MNQNHEPVWASKDNTKENTTSKLNTNFLNTKTENYYSEQISVIRAIGAQKHNSSQRI